jgi:hypothetical protein
MIVLLVDRLQPLVDFFRLFKADGDGDSTESESGDTSGHTITADSPVALKEDADYFMVDSTFDSVFVDPIMLVASTQASNSIPASQSQQTSLCLPRVDLQTVKHRIETRGLSVQIKEFRDETGQLVHIVGPNGVNVFSISELTSPKDDSDGHQVNSNDLRAKILKNYFMNCRSTASDAAQLIEHKIQDKAPARSAEKASKSTSENSENRSTPAHASAGMTDDSRVNASHRASTGSPQVLPKQATTVARKTSANETHDETTNKPAAEPVETEEDKRMAALLKEEAEKELYRGEYLPTMFASIYSQQQFVPIACNSNKMIPFKTEIFEGHVLLMINSGSGANPYQTRFSGQASKYRMEIQVQGQCDTVIRSHIGLLAYSCE